MCVGGEETGAGGGAREERVRGREVEGWAGGCSCGNEY